MQFVIKHERKRFMGIEAESTSLHSAKRFVYSVPKIMTSRDEREQCFGKSIQYVLNRCKIFSTEFYMWATYRLTNKKYCWFSSHLQPGASPVLSPRPKTLRPCNSYVVRHGFAVFHPYLSPHTSTKVTNISYLHHEPFAATLERFQAFWQEVMPVVWSFCDQYEETLSEHYESLKHILSSAWYAYACRELTTGCVAPALLDFFFGSSSALHTRCPAQRKHDAGMSACPTLLEASTCLNSWTPTTVDPDQTIHFYFDRLNDLHVVFLSTHEAISLLAHAYAHLGMVHAYT